MEMEWGRRDWEHKPVPQFTSQEELLARQGKFRKSRFAYLQALVSEFQDTEDMNAKEEVLANLANFAYDPINYEWLRQLHVVDLFLDMLTEESETLKEFGIGGLCNMCNDPINAALIFENEGIPLIISCLSSSRLETVLSAITTLYYLLSPQTKPVIATKAVLDCMRKFAESSNIRLKNLASIFLQDAELVS